MKVSPEKGFTLVELLVSVGIFTAITTMAVFNNAQFNSSVLLTNLAYEIGLSIRQAQVYGITVRQTTEDATKFDSGYGIHFDLSSPSQYLLFEDVRPTGGSTDHIYNSISDEDIETFYIQKGNKLSKICVDSNCGSEVVDITFIRPNPDAYIRVSSGPTPYDKAEICVASGQGTMRKIVVESTGQISVTAEDMSICDE